VTPAKPANAGPLSGSQRHDPATACQLAHSAGARGAVAAPRHALMLVSGYERKFPTAFPYAAARHRGSLRKSSKPKMLERRQFLRSKKRQKIGLWKKGWRHHFSHGKRASMPWVIGSSVIATVAPSKATPARAIERPWPRRRGAYTWSKCRSAVMICVRRLSRAIPIISATRANSGAQLTGSLRLTMPSIRL
jgi:hypothetical protein